MLVSITSPILKENVNKCPSQRNFGDPLYLYASVLSNAITHHDALHDSTERTLTCIPSCQCSGSRPQKRGCSSRTGQHPSGQPLPLSPVCESQVSGACLVCLKAVGVAIIRTAKTGGRKIERRILEVDTVCQFRACLNFLRG